MPYVGVYLVNRAGVGLLGAVIVAFRKPSSVYSLEYARYGSARYGIPRYGCTYYGAELPAGQYTLIVALQGRKPYFTKEIVVGSTDIVFKVVCGTGGINVVPLIEQTKAPRDSLTVTIVDTKSNIPARGSNTIISEK